MADLYDRYGRRYLEEMLYDRDLRSFDPRVPDPRPHRSRLVVGSTEICYKPGWQMGYHRDEVRDCAWLHLNWSVPDAYRPERTTMVSSVSAVSPLRPIQEQVYHAIRTAELHELDEFFMVDGHRPYDPHRESRP